MKPAPPVTITRMLVSQRTREARIAADASCPYPTYRPYPRSPATRFQGPDRSTEHRGRIRASSPSSPCKQPRYWVQACTARGQSPLESATAASSPPTARRRHDGRRWARTGAGRPQRRIFDRGQRAPACPARREVFENAALGPSRRAPRRGGSPARNRERARRPRARCACRLRTRTRGYRRVSSASAVLPRRSPSAGCRACCLPTPAPPSGRHSAQFSLDRLDDPVLVAFFQVRMHRQADHLVGKALADRQSVARQGIATIGGLAVQWQRIVDGGRDAARLEASGQPVTARGRDADRVLRPYRARALGQFGDAGNARELRIVARRDPVAARDLVAKDAQLLDENRRLQGIHASVEADADVVVFVGALAMDAQAFHQLGESI